MSKLKLVILMFLIFCQCSFSDDVCILNKGDDIVCMLLNVLRGYIKNGNSKLELPPLDPWKIDHLPLNLSNNMLCGKLSLQNFTATGLSLFEVTEAIGLDNTSIRLHFSSLHLKTYYDSQLKLMDMVNLYGKGNLVSQISNINLKITFIIESPEIKIVNATFILNSPTPIITATFTGLLNDEFMSDIISRQFSATITALLNEHQTVLNKLLTKAFQDLVDKNINSLFVDSNGTANGNLMDVITNFL